MSEQINIQNSLLEAMNIIAQRRINQLNLDKTIVAIINSSVGVVDGRNIYKVEYEGGFFNATAQSKDAAYLPRMAVYVQIPEGDFSREKFILGKASSFATDIQTSVVSALASNYSIVGRNIINNPDNEKIGVYSYHSPNEETSDQNSISHRFNFLYQNDEEKHTLGIIDQQDFDLYKKESTAIMIKAEFMTKLTDEQKKRIAAEYGLVFNLRFKNLAAGIGETQQEVFKALQDKLIVSGTDGDISIEEQNAQLINYLDEKSYDELVSTDGFLDNILSNVQEIARVYKENTNSSQYDENAVSLISSYIYLLQDMKRVTRAADDDEGLIAKQKIIDIYYSWMEETVGQSAEKKISYYLSSNDMIGNPFSFSSWISQYAVFEIDLENLIGIDSILLYKQGFIEDSVKEQLWQYDEITGKNEPDILVKDIQMYMMRPLSEDVAGYQLKVEDKENGMIFTGENQEAEITVQGTLFRELYEDLTQNADTEFYWFKQSDIIISPIQEGYSVYGGIGWRKLENENSYKLKLNIKDNPGYETHYRCAVVYKGEETPIVLRYDFIVYNYSGEEFILQSNLGNSFTFDAGYPILTVYKKQGDDFKEIYEELPTKESEKKFKFKWAIIDGNNQKTFLDEKVEIDLTNITTAEYLNYANAAKLLQDIQWYSGKTLLGDFNKEFATKIQYPMSNIASASTVTFECYINKRNEDGEYYLLSKAILTLNNFKLLNANSYRIYIENGDQVFQYDEYGNAPNSQKRKDPQEILPIKVHLFAPNNIEVQQSSFRVKWTFPTKESLIEYEGAEIDPATGLENLFKTNEVSFKIKELYDYNAIDNQIKCQIDFNDRTLYSETSFSFTKIGNNGTNGTDVTAKIEPKDWKNIYLTQPFTLYIDTVNKEIFTNGDVPKTHKNPQSSATINLTDCLSATLYQKSQKIEKDINVRWNIAGNTSTSTNKNGKYITLSNNSLTWEYPSSQGTLNQFILRAELLYDKKSYYAFFNLPIIFYNGRIPLTESARIGINRNTYLKEIIYNADGRNPLYNHNQGLELVNIKEGYKVDFKAKGGSDNDNNETKPCFKIFLESDTEEEPRTAITTDNFNAKVLVLPDDDFNGAVTNNYIEATIRKDNQVIATVIAPISMSLNTFGLASLNAWDGNSILTDDEQGYIMAPQVGAGYKTESNLFTGVVMGQADDYSSGEKHLYTGLFGYKDGIRSFFLDAETGNSTFGYPSLETDDEKYRWYDKETGKWILKDNYGEGAIELCPGGVSKIGGWRLGQRSLYYTRSGEIGEGYTDDYASHHKKDIEHEDEGILLSAIPAYISIKGKKWKAEDVSESDDTQIQEGDSLEIQLDPENAKMFTLFRHYKQSNDVYARTMLAGINSKGQLIANSMQQVPAKVTDSSASSALGITSFNAFGSTKDNYIGLNLEAGKDISDTISFLRIFVDKSEIGKANTQGSTPMYITGGRTSTKGDYNRPISMHGQTLSFYANNTSDADNSKKTSDNYIQITESKLSGYVNYVDTNNVGSGFNFVEGQNNTSTVNAEGVLKVTSVGALTVTSGNPLTATNGNSFIKIGDKAIQTRINENNMFQLTDGDTSPSNTFLKSTAKIVISTIGNNANDISISSVGDTTIVSNNAISITSKKITKLDSDDTITIRGLQTNTASQGGIDNSAVTIKAQSKDDKARHNTVLYLNPAQQIETNSSTMFRLDAGRTSLSVETLKVGDNLLNYFNVGAHTNLRTGAYVQGKYDGIYGLTVDEKSLFKGNVTIDNASLTADGNIKANGQFTGKGNGLTHVADSDLGDNVTIGEGINISGWGSSGTARFPKVTLTDGRPRFASDSITVTIPNKPTLSDLGGITPAEVDAKITNALKDYVSKTTYENHVHHLGYRTSSVTIEEKRSTAEFVDMIGKDVQEYRIDTTHPFPQ